MSDKEILLVKGNSAARDLVLSSLGDMASRTVVVGNAAEARDFLLGDGRFADGDLHRPIRLILLDLTGPGVSDFECLRMLKDDARTRTIPVVVLSSTGDEGNVAESYRLGANSYVVKPSNASQFASVIERTVRYWTKLNLPVVAC